MSDFRAQLDGLPPLRDVIAQHDLRAEKSLGQNFLLDQNITDKIVRGCAEITDAHVIEIGPGPGGLTRSLLRGGAHSLTAIEFDPRAVRALADLQEASAERLTIVQGDALEVDCLSLCPAPRVIVSNLPYNVATPLLVGWLRQIYDNPAAYRSMALMFQKEVAERIVARVGDKPYGRLGVLAGWLTNARVIYDLPPSAFTPPPKVKSAVVRFEPKTRKGTQPSFEVMEALTAAAFGQRRKMIRSSLKAYMPAIEALGIDPTLRAENLDLESFVKIAAFKE